MADDSLTVLVQEVVMIRKLMVFSLLNSGISQENVANALGVSQPTVSRLAGSKPVKKKRKK